MKKFKLVFVSILSVFLFLTSCGGDGDTEPVDNDIVIGTYTGVLVGSTGHFSIDLKEKGSTVIIVFDGKTTPLSSNEILVKGQEIKELTFTDGTISLILSVDKKGDNPTVKITIPNHNVLATISKASEDNPVILFEGEYFEQISNDNGATYQRTGVSKISNLSVHGNKFTLLSTPVNCNCDDDGKVFTEKGIIVSKDENSLTIRTTHKDDGPGTPLVKIDALDQKESEATFTIKDGNLSLINEQRKTSPEGKEQIYTFEYHYKRVK